MQFCPDFPRVHVLNALTARPAKLVGLADRKGAIVTSHDADLVVFDPDAEFTVAEEMLHHRHKSTTPTQTSLPSATKISRAATSAWRC